MKAVRFDRYGGVEVLQVAEVPMPEPSHNEALVKVKAASINPGEAKIREGLLHAMWPATFPSGEGSDLAGIVAKIGSGVEGFKVGDEVIGFTDRRASHAEYLVIEAQNLSSCVAARLTIWVGAADPQSRSFVGIEPKSVPQSGHRSRQQHNLAANMSLPEQHEGCLNLIQRECRGDRHFQIP